MIMKTVLLIVCFVLFVFDAISTNSKRDVYLHALDEETYDTLLSLVKGEFDVPVSERTKGQRNAVVRYWRRRDLFQLGPRSTLFFSGRRVVRKRDIPKIVEDTFKYTKSAGYKKLKHRTVDSYAGLSERGIRHVTSSSEKFRRHNAKFDNKRVPRPVTANHIHSQHQIDLIDFSKQPVLYQGKTQRYIMSVIDIFSRFLWLEHLPRKTSQNVARELTKIYDEHGPPRRLQCDRGREFDGEVLTLCKRYKIKRIRSSPYHPQSQGKVERSHRRLRQKLFYDMVEMGRKGVNWAENLKTYCRILNEEPKEELGWMSPFEVYFGRKSNMVLLSSIDDFDINTRGAGVKAPNKQKIRDHCKRVRTVRKKAKLASTRMNKNMVTRFKKSHQASRYSVGEDVLIRYFVPRKKSLAPRKRYVLKGRVLERNTKSWKYKVRFHKPETNVMTSQWISVEDITSLTSEKERQKRSTKERRHKRYLHRQRYLIPLTQKEKLRPFGEHVEVLFNPPGNGNCQFMAICFWLRTIGIERSPETLRKDIIQNLINNPSNPEGFPLELFAGMPWSEYIDHMSRDGSYGDHVTLQAAADIFSVRIIVYSTLGHDATTTICPASGNHFATFYLGHFAEGHGDHYVSLSPDQQHGYHVDTQVDHDSPGDSSTSSRQKNNLSTSQPVLQCDEESSCHTSIDDLPNEILLKIMEMVLYPPTGESSIMYQRLRSVSRRFQECVYTCFPNCFPKIYYPRGSSGTVSVKKLIRESGQASGLVLELKDIIGNNRWHHAWLQLYALQFGWFAITNIYWRNQYSKR